MGVEVRKRRDVWWYLYQPYKWLIFAPLLGLSTCFFVGLGFIMLFFTSDRVVNRTALFWWARFVSFITPMRVKVIGEENVRKGQSYIVVSNHQSTYDALILVGWLRFDIKWVMKTELRDFPVFGWAAEKGGQIIIDRSNPKAAYESLKDARSKIEGGVSIMMLVEGTRSHTGELLEFKRGAFWLAHELELPILPITICNTMYIHRPKTFDLFPGNAVMKIHPPVDVSRYDRVSYDKLMSDVKGIIQTGLDEYQIWK